ncbi:Hypothetical predicted protein, partial [Pelobates cultripes]
MVRQTETNGDQPDLLGNRKQPRPVMKSLGTTAMARKWRKVLGRAYTRRKPGSVIDGYLPRCQFDQGTSDGHCAHTWKA